MKRSFINDIEEFNMIFNYINSNDLDVSLNRESKKNLKKKSKNYSIVKNMLYFIKDNKALEVLKPWEGNTIFEKLEKLHSKQHLGMTKFYKEASEYYYNFTRIITDKIVRDCSKCKEFKPLKTHNRVIPLLFQRPWEHVQIDAVDLRKYESFNDGFNWVVNLIDCYSKFPFSFPCKTKSALEVCILLKKLFNSEGCPNTLHSDNGKEFKNKMINEYLDSKNIRFIQGRVRHPQTQRCVERFNQTIIRKLTLKLNSNGPRRWIDFLDETVYEYNTNWHRATNQTPFNIFRGRSSIVRFEDKINLLDIDGEIFEPESIKTDDLEIDSKDINLFNESNSYDRIISDVSEGLSDEIDEVYDDVNVEYKSPVEILELPVIDDNYRSKYISSSLSSEYLLKFYVGDKVLIIKDFDNNLKSKKSKFDKYVSTDVIIINDLGDNFYNVKIKNMIKKYCANQFVLLSRCEK